MNLKKSLAGLFAGFALLGAVAAPAAMAVDPSATSPITIVVLDGGTMFTVGICSAGFDTGATSPTANTPGTATGTIGICYTNDTLSFRPHFNTMLSASDFIGQESASHTIDASNFKVTKTNSIGALQWTSQHPSEPRIGDIGFLASDGSVAPGQSNPAGNSVWSTNNSLDTARAVQFRYAGRGALWSGGNVNVSLNIPAGTVADNYTSQLLVTIMFTTDNP